MIPLINDADDIAVAARENWTHSVWTGAADDALNGRIEVALAEVNQVLSRSAVYRSNIVLLRSADGKRNRPSPSWADVQKGIEDGLSLQVRNLELFLSPDNEILRIAKAVEQATRARLDSITLFVSPENSQAIRIHSDPTEILTIQVRGMKEWGFGHDGVRQRIVKLKPRDLLYVPAGVQHEVVAGSEPSVSVALVFETPTLRTILDLIADQEPIKSILKKRLPAPWDEARSSRDASLMLTELSRELQALSETGLLAFMPQARPTSDRVDLLGLQRRDGVSLDTELARTDAAARLDDRDSCLRLHIDGVTLEAPVYLEQELLAAMTATGRIRPRDLSSKLAEDECVVLARKLVRVGLLRLAQTEPSL